MENLQFKTDLKCAGCMYAIKPYMDSLEGIESWDVDLESPEKRIRVVSSLSDQEDVCQAVEKAFTMAGYTAELVD